MKLWKLCVLTLICSGLFVAFGLSGCGDDNPCENGDPDTCANIANTVEYSCFVIEQEDFACICKKTADESYAWNENSHTCVLEAEE